MAGETANCFHCKRKTTMVNTSESRTKNGAIMVKGYCQVCGGKCCTIKSGR